MIDFYLRAPWWDWDSESVPVLAWPGWPVLRLAHGDQSQIPGSHSLGWAGGIIRDSSLPAAECQVIDMAPSSPQKWPIDISCPILKNCIVTARN